MATSRPTLFGDLPRDVIEILCADFSPAELGIFARTSRQVEEGSAFARLLSSALYAEPESYKQEDPTRLAALAILRRHPELLFQEGEITDHYGRQIKATPYRLLLGAGDVWARKQVHATILPQIEDAEAKAEAEFKIQFPDYKGPWPPADMSEEALYDARNKKQIEEVKAQLQIVVAAITGDPCTDGQAMHEATTQAVAELCKIFAPKAGEIIATGLHFPLGIMREIYSVYDADNGWDYDRCSYFSRVVIGAAVKASSAVDGQCYKHGLKYLDMDQGPDRRDGLCCRQPKGVLASKSLQSELGISAFVDPYDGVSCFRQGVSLVFDCYDKCGWWSPELSVSRCVFLLASLQTYVEQKHRAWQTLRGGESLCRHRG